MHASPQLLDDPDANQFREMCWGCGSARAVLVVERDYDTEVNGGIWCRLCSRAVYQDCLSKDTPASQTARCSHQRGWPDPCPTFSSPTPSAPLRLLRQRGPGGTCSTPVPTTPRGHATFTGGVSATPVFWSSASTACPADQCRVRDACPIRPPE